VLSTILSLALAVGLAAVVIVPAQRIAQGNARGDRLARATAEVGSLHPLRLLELVAPGSMGDPYTDYVAGPWVGEPGLGDRPVVYGSYLGASVIVLASFAFGRRRRGPLILGLVAAFLVWTKRDVRTLVQLLISAAARAKVPRSPAARVKINRIPMFQGCPGRRKPLLIGWPLLCKFCAVLLSVRIYRHPCDASRVEFLSVSIQ